MPYYIGPQKWWLDLQPKTIVTDGLVLNLDAGNPASYSGTGTTWTDLSGNGNDGTLVNGVGYDSANEGSLVFNGSNQYGTIPYNSTFDLSGDYALEGWFKVPSFNNGFQLISKDTYGSNYDWGITVINNTTIRIYTGNAGPSFTATVPQLQPNTWYDIVITGISGTTKICVNAVEYGSGSFNLSNNSQSFVSLGCASWNNPGGLINGDISVLRVYQNKGLTQREVTQNYNALKDRYPTIVTDGIVLNLDAGNPASYPGSGTTWTDLSGNGNDGTLVNGVSYDSANEGSLVFDGANDYVDITPTNNIEPSSLTIFCFIKPQVSFEPEDIIMHAGDSGLLGFRLMTRAYKDGGGYGTGWAFWPTPGLGTLPEGSTLSLDTWYCLAVTYTSSQLKLYTNAVCDITVNTPDALSYGNQLQICHGVGGFQNSMRGEIPIMLIYNRALTQQEITQNYNAIKGRYEV